MVVMVVPLHMVPMHLVASVSTLSSITSSILNFPTLVIHFFKFLKKIPLLFD